MWVCDECAAKQILDGRAKPLAEVWGPNDYPWKPDGKCELCGAKGYVANNPTVIGDRCYAQD